MLTVAAFIYIYQTFFLWSNIAILNNSFLVWCFFILNNYCDDKAEFSAAVNPVFSVS